MAFYDKFPYTNYQELNLDWLLNEVSKVRDNRDASDASAAAALASEQAAKASETAAASSQQAAANSETAAAGSEAASAEYLEQIGTHTAGAVADWLKENLTSTTPPIDASLTISGAAADAKKTGDAISSLNEDVTDLDELFNWGTEKTNILNGKTPVVGAYVNYSTGGIGKSGNYEWYEISVTEGQTLKYNGNNAHVAFFSKKYNGTTIEYYLSGLLTQKNIAFTVPKNAVSMTLSVLINYPNWLGNGDDEYRQNTTIKKECLPKDKQIIVGGTDGTYTNIVKAVKECEENTTIIVRSGTYDLEAQFKEVYGDDFFVNYKGYSADSNFELSGLYLKRGVKLIADSGTVLSFMYSGNNPKVSKEFSPVNMTLDNIVDGLIIEVNSNVRYHIHDDFAFQAFSNVNNYGRNEIKNCIFKGNSTAGSAIGGGMGTYCKYIVHDNYFENTSGNAVTYHNSSFSDAQNFIDIFNNYAETPIKLHWYGASTKITTALVHNNTASLIECTKIPNYDAPNENIKMKAWNNNIGTK